MTSFYCCLLQQLAFSKLRHFSWDKDPANAMAYDTAATAAIAQASVESPTLLPSLMCASVRVAAAAAVAIAQASKGQVMMPGHHHPCCLCCQCGAAAATAAVLLLSCRQEMDR